MKVVTVLFFRLKQGTDLLANVRSDSWTYLCPPSTVRESTFLLVLHDGLDEDGGEGWRKRTVRDEESLWSERLVETDQDLV